MKRWLAEPPGWLIPALLVALFGLILWGSGIFDSETRRWGEWPAGAYMTSYKNCIDDNVTTDIRENGGATTEIIDSCVCVVDSQVEADPGHREDWAGGIRSDKVARAYNRSVKDCLGDVKHVPLISPDSVPDS